MFLVRHDVLNTFFYILLFFFFFFLRSGIFVSPALVSYFQGPLLAASPEDESANTAGGSVDFIMVLKQLGLTVLLPLVIGQAIQILFTEPVAKFKVKCRLSDVSSFCLLLMVWSVFSDAVHAGSFSAVAGKDIAAVVILNFLFYVLFSAFSFLLARLPYSKRIFGPLKWLERLRYSREDTVAVMVCVCYEKKKIHLNNMTYFPL